MSNSYIFCQAPTKISATLLCYENECSLGNRVTIIVNVENMAKFFCLLGLKANIECLTTFVIKHSTLLESNRLKRLVKNDIQRIGIDRTSDSRIFFTDICDNFMMGLYLAELKTHPIFKIQAHMDIKKGLDGRFERERIPFKLKVKEFLFSKVFGYHFLYTRIDHWTLTLDIREYNYPLLDFSDMSVCNRYQIPLPEEGCHRVIFFTEPYRNKFQTEEDYMAINKTIITSLQSKNYKVGIKGHPRIGLPDELKDMADFEIPAYIPSEFIDIKGFDFAIGFVSTSICSASSQIKAYSVLPMCTIIDEPQVVYWHDYIDKQSNGKVIYLSDFNQIESIN